jgi:hypothetical protein
VSYISSYKQNKTELTCVLILFAFFFAASSVPAVTHLLQKNILVSNKKGNMTSDEKRITASSKLGNKEFLLLTPNLLPLSPVTLSPVREYISSVNMNFLYRRCPEYQLIGGRSFY